VDRCRDHGLWLDAGELRQLLEWARAGGALLDLERRQEQALEEARRRHRERQESAGVLAEAEAQADRPWLGALARDDIGDLLLRLARRLG
jgi:hypothetical protein